MNVPSVIKLPAEAALGPAMRNLPTDRQRLFVVAMLETGGRNISDAARLAGYADNGNGTIRVLASRLSHDEKILAAMSEESTRRLQSGQILAVSTVLSIMDNGAAKDSDRLKAAEMLMNRTGMHATSEHKVTTQDISRTDDEVMERIKFLAKNLGLDPKALAREHGIVIDVTPTPLIEAPQEPDSCYDGLEDL